MATLAETLDSIDGRGYSGYQRIRGRHRLRGCELSVDHIQADPYAPPSKIRLFLDHDLPADLMDTAPKRVAVGDFLARAVARELGRDFSIGSLQQQVLPRTAVLIGAGVEVRLTVALPAAGRRVKGRLAQQLLCEELPEVAARLRRLDQRALRAHVELYLDQRDLRSQLLAGNLVAFVGEGAILPRESGDSDLPLDDAEPFRSPASLRVSFRLPSGREVSGMGVPEGITVIIGGGYHGKSTLLRAMERGVYPHIAGDGREWVITRPDAVSIRAEDGRPVTGVDISPFITGLPGGTDTTCFSTTNASGSTSQAANLMEALEAGTSLLLIDEDTSATNFMIRDRRMRALIPADREPITPFIDRVSELRDQRGTSSILVSGGSGDFFDVADRVIAMDAYLPSEVTSQAREIAAQYPAASSAASPVDFAAAPRVPVSASLQPADKRKPARARGGDTLQYGKSNIDLSALSQLVDPAQTEAIALALEKIAAAADNRASTGELVAQLYQSIEREGLDWLSSRRGHPGLYSLPRPQEVLAALNRFRGLRIQR
ncbi:ABC-ATPase domain-containing protein [Corynebacterium sp. A21]|uniref:ABC-ATPase domain-containing protein n=1 Tax=Corynebacterium sp. A21 TaxID=3457318 RepID=UPI003FD1DA9E